MDLRLKKYGIWIPVNFISSAFAMDVGDNSRSQTPNECSRIFN